MSTELNNMLEGLESAQWDLSEHGTPLEIKHAEWIKNEFCGYKTVWEKFIGKSLNNNGKLQPAPLRGPNGELIEIDQTRHGDRLGFALYHYNLLESLHLLQTIRNELPAKKYSLNDDPCELLRTHVLVYTLIDRLRELLKKAGESLNHKSIITNEHYGVLDELSAIRNAVVHEIRLPMKDDGSGPGFKSKAQQSGRGMKQEEEAA